MVIDIDKSMLIHLNKMRKFSTKFMHRNSQLPMQIVPFTNLIVQTCTWEVFFNMYIYSDVSEIFIPEMDVCEYMY